MQIIDKQKTLEEFCNKLANHTSLSIDTEFERRYTYYAQLSIIQVKAEGYCGIIDTLSNLDLNIFNKLLIDNNITKIFHAPREDLEIFYNLFKTLPSNIFDIQIAASICGFGQQLSYDNLCYKLIGITIDKTHQKSNWLKRPITNDMLNYAILDVEYLYKIYKELNNIIISNNLTHKYQHTLSALLDVRNYKVELKDAWKKIRYKSDDENFNRTIQVLAAYREENAQTINIPRKHFILDEDLIKLCKNMPLNYKDFKNLKLKSKYLHKKKYKDEIINLFNNL
ncbi:ribonuclease D [Rickettsia prowazekii]|uniref:RIBONUCLEASE D (Rnd) n=3 Tax=Rickettsia prowazekii TaxID=782 RepID=Q9ZD81_RICPR|nr:ribonuclease D [Rickettsia prowazekii]EOB09830.1 Ribonuclease D [Rickettsia prowazekii str. GvF12]ADE29993.1 Ribonuclease D [Rickettsia prowazekii str. Rp22]AFE49274.1 ribonuclease D [Rickettsia prowazekii str. Chernikova]AFE50120.1 ribonuclease D [Rickettsia prowazekii str. Katsinyian]AFE50965.1 ribonuclease D [Rickettsia prowazekii str. BuV67-CWPP]